MSQAEADFSRKWKEASPIERRAMIQNVQGHGIREIVEGYLIGENRKAAEAFLGKPTSVESDGTLVFQASGRVRILVHFDKQGKVKRCIIIG
jgi:hypothetical protein